MLKHQNKKVFTIATADEQKRADLEQRIRTHVQDCVVYYAIEAPEALQKVKNVPPHVLFTDHELLKGKDGYLVEAVLADEALKQTAILILSPLPERENYLDELVTGRVQFLDDQKYEAEFGPALAKALNYSAQLIPSDFFLKFLQPGEILMKEGDHAEHVYILRKGSLRAWQLKDVRRVEIGTIEPGEFVGEMAYFNGEPRMATVEAISACELIEIPIGTFEKVLYARPAWSKTLLQTLSKRLRKTAKA